MLIKAFKQQRQVFIERYLIYYKKHQNNPNNLDTLGHLHEISYVLITVFGVTSKQIEMLEQGGVLWED